MNQKFTTTNFTSTDTKNVLIVGFDNFSYILMNENNEADLGYYKFEKSDDSFQAYRWLEERLAENPNSDTAVICSYNFLQEDNFNLLKNIQLNKSLKTLPFLVVCEEEEFDLDREIALKMGIDDCYTEPVNWSDLRVRLEFLFSFKADLMKAAGQPEENMTINVPVGKRVFDIVFASAVLLALAPVLLTIALLIRCGSSGPIIYRSKRIGRGYQEFDFLKFRSMCVDADAKRCEVAHLNNYDGGAFLKVKNDPRITTVGKFIRKTSLDELPQLWNVIRGDMSIVGNRPLPLDEAAAVTKDEWALRFGAPAGITGLWQTVPTGKDTMSVEERIGLDIEYAKKFSLLMDARIISRTLPAMIQKGE